MQKILKAFMVLLIACFLVGCGGGSEEDDSNNEPSSFVPDCNGEYCGSIGNNYTGSGVGIWRYKNVNSGNVAINVSLSNVTNKDIMVVFTNEGTSNVNLPSISINTVLKNEIYPHEEEYIDTYNYLPDDIKNFESPELIEQDNKLNFNSIPLYKIYNENDNRKWNVPVDFAPVSRTVTLRKQISTSSRNINIWVEDSEYSSGKINDTKIVEIASSVKNIYSSVVGLIGEPWGTHRYSNLISSDQPLDIVLVNFDNNKKAFGTVGYFWSRDNFLKTADSDTADSNEALALAIDTETYYLDGNGKFYTLSTIAHELTHAVNFYQRHVVMGSGNAFDTFLDEMLAVMMEDIISSKISFNEVSSRYENWLKTPLYHQNFADWKNNVASYDVAGSFGAYLLRQYGINFYKTLLGTRSNLSTSNLYTKSIDILDKAIKQYSGYGLTRTLQRWGAGIAMLPAAAAPKGFGYPAKNDSNGFNLEAFDGKDYKQYRTLFNSSPSTLAPYAHFPFLRRTTNYRYEDIFTVPKDVSVTIVVQ
jgi:hypothetical protein